jgi:hypothetical protein
MGASYDPVEEFMPTIVWNPHSFHSINVLEKGRGFKAMHYVTEILSPLSQRRASHAMESDHKVIVHADNTRPHTRRPPVEFFKDNRMKTVPYHPYSPGITPFDFYLFNRVKEYLADCSFIGAEGLFEAVRGVIDSIETVTLQAVFLGWMDRLRMYIQTNSDSTE